VDDPTLMEEDGVDRGAEVNVARKHERWELGVEK
jgi:hypothetical protein